MYTLTRSMLKDFKLASETEFYMPNGLGGYLSATACNNLFRKHNAYLIYSFNAPVDRYVLLSKVVENVVIGNDTFSLDAQEYDGYTKKGNVYLDSFEYGFIPTYKYKIGNVWLTKRMAPVYGDNITGIEYSIKNESNSPIRLILTPYLNNKFLGDTQEMDKLKSTYKTTKASYIINYSNIRTILRFSEGTIIKRRLKYSDMMYERFDQETGDARLDFSYTPIDIEIEVPANTEKVVSLTASVNPTRLHATRIIDQYEKRIKGLIRDAHLHDELANNLVVSTDSFISYRKSTDKKTILAGLPWFADWGRDTMISFTGALLVTKRFSEAREVLLSFKEYERDGLIPNMFPTNNEEPLYNTVDASLWYFIACYKYIKYTNDFDFIINNLYDTLYNIYINYRRGTKFNIHMDSDGLIIAGSDLDQITWMDVRVDNVVVTPRHGKPVEINALWYNALKIMELLSKRSGRDSLEFSDLSELVYNSFNQKFYNKELNSLYDVIDQNDASIRPNQLFAIGLPFKVLDKDLCKNVLLTCKRELYTKYGIRSLAISDPRFKPKYEGKLWDRDMAYHMGTAWGWLMGIYIDSYLYVYDYSPRAIKDVKEMILNINLHMHEYCLNGIAEIFDGENPKISRGCSNQAWSAAEVLRAYYENLISRRIHVRINK